MPAGAKRRSPTWQQALLLLIGGIVIGYPSFININIWGGTVSRYQSFYVLGFFVGAAAFISGFASFLAIAVRAVSSPTESSRGIDASLATPVPAFAGNVVKGQASVPSGAAIALTRLRFTLIAALSLASVVVLRGWERPSLTSSYGRYYWLNKALTLLLSQLPYAVALIRTWKIPDRVGLALAMVAGAAQLLLTFFPGFRYDAARLDPWPWLSAAFGLTVVVFAYLAWRPLFSRKGNIGLVISIFFGFMAYTCLAQMSLAVLYYHELRWISSSLR